MLRHVSIENVARMFPKGIFADCCCVPITTPNKNSQRTATEKGLAS